MSESLPASSARQKFAVIDIGSNSLRLVVYDVDMQVPFQIFNEKVLSALGKGLSATGHLNPEGWESAQNAILRFCALAREMRVERLITVATAAVRDAVDGPEFVKEAQNRCGIRIRVLTGEEEAHYSALGVIAGIRGADGLVGDLGGGSLELVDLPGGEPATGVSLPIGPLRLMDSYGADTSKAVDDIRKLLGKIDWLKGGKNRPFYVVGGAWRALAKLHMHRHKYPLNILHNYIMPTDDLSKLCEEVAALQGDDLQSISGVVANRRLTSLPHASMVLGELIRVMKPSSVVISGFGLREGLAFEQIFHGGAAPDLLIEMSRELARTKGRFGDHGDEIEEWIAPVLDDMSESSKRLRHAACLLSDIGWAGHPDYRAEVVLQDVLYSQLVDVDHEGRAFVAQALFVCYGGKAAKSPIETMSTPMQETVQREAEILGLALRLAQRISGGTEGILTKCDLKMVDDTLVLRVPEEHGHLVSEVVERRLKNLATAMGKEYRIER